VINGDGIQLLMDDTTTGQSLDSLLTRQNDGQWIAIGTFAGISIATLKSHPIIGGFMLYIDTIYAVLEATYSGNMELEYYTLKELLVLGKDLGINVVLEFYHTATDTGVSRIEYRNNSFFYQVEIIYP